MDISGITTSNYLHKLVHPGTGRYLGLTIELAPTTDPAFKTLERQITDKALTKRIRGKVTKSEEIEENRTVLISAVIRGFIWENDADGKPGSFGGEQMKFSPENVAKLLAVEWIKDQIDEALAEQANFFKR